MAPGSVNQDAPADAIDCPSSTLCVAAGVEGQVLTSRDPTARTPWRHTALDAPRGGPGRSSVSRASLTRCVVTEPGAMCQHNRSQRSRSDMASCTPGPQPPRCGARPLSRIPTPAPLSACRTADVCAVASDGSVWASTARAPGGRRRWTRVVSEPRGATMNYQLISLACVRGQLCVATDADGHALSASAVTGPEPGVSKPSGVRSRQPRCQPRQLGCSARAVTASTSIVT
jgi:hypothetical protein